MVTQVPIGDAPDQDEPLLKLYEDRLIDTTINFVYEDNHPYLSEVTASKFYEGTIEDDYAPYISPQHKTDSGSSKRTNATDTTKQEYDDFSDTKQKLVKGIEEEWSFGKQAGTWTVKDAYDETGMKSEDTTRRYVNDLKDKNWVMETGDKDSGNRKLYKLKKSRLVKSDGGVPWDYRERWERAIDHLESGNYVKHPGNEKYPENKEDKENFVKRDWFLAHNVEPVVEIFQRIKAINTHIWDIHLIRKELHQDWQYLMPFMRKEKMTTIRETLKELGTEFRKLFGKFKQLMSAMWTSCSRWLEQHKGSTDEIKDYNNPEGMKDECLLTLNAKQKGLVTTHTARLKRIDPKGHLGDRDSYTDQIYNLEVVTRNFLHWAWEFYEYLTEGVSPPDVEEAPHEVSYDEDEIEETEEEDDPIDDLPGQLVALEAVLEDEWWQPISQGKDDAMSWDELVDRYHGWINASEDDLPRESMIASRLERLHDYYWRGDGEYAGIYVWDKHDFDPTKEPEYEIKLVYDESWAEKRQHQMEWPDHRDLELPPH